VNHTAKDRIGVIGGGPSGLTAAWKVACAGHPVDLFERQEQPGRKLMASGGGRGNLTNLSPRETFFEAYGPHGRFTQDALRAYGPGDLRDDLLALGVPTGAPDGQRIYPCSDSARDVRDALLAACKELCRQIRHVHIGLDKTCPDCGMCQAVIAGEAAIAQAEGKT